MLQSFFRCLGTLLLRVETIVGVFLTIGSGALKMTNIYDVPIWVWPTIAAAVLFVMAVRLQMTLDENPHVQKLMNRSYVSFGEISEAIPRANDAYGKQDVLKALRKARELGHFKSWGGLSRLRIKARGWNGPYRDKYPIFYEEEYRDFTQNDAEPTKGVQAFEESMLWAATSNGNRDAEESFVIESPEFRRWYRRFRNGRYER